ncbi:uncharacterized protein LOC117331294 [Pecten maximus]|uniref:uncharacterized protein LOC117331294 n=1 Tax=Pecten maximus TaxID=6579 RepID=UPI001458C571|nr:uncharacterized protein LOC117331294 [Pecten maximus]
MADRSNSINKENEDVNLQTIDWLTVQELKSFLRQHDQPVSGRSTELKERAKGVLKLGIRRKDILQREDERQSTLYQARKFVSPLGEILPHPSTLKNWTDNVRQIPVFLEDALYNYLVLNRQRTFDNAPMGAVKQLKAKVFYEDSHVHHIRYSPITDLCSHCYVSCKVVPSMPTADVNKSPDYSVWICISKQTGQVHAADCNCPAGNGESCNHVAGLLYGLVDITEKKQSGELAPTAEPCKWSQPKKRKLSPKKAEQMKFRKCTNTGNADKSDYTSFRPSGVQPPLDRDSFLAEMKEVLPNAGYTKLFPKQKAPEHVLQECCLPEPKFNFHDSVDLSSSACQIEFDNYVQDLIDNSACTDTIEGLTKGQSKNDVWLKARIGRITASRFGVVCRRKQDVNPNSLVKSVMGYYSDKTNDGMEWGINHERTANLEYIQKMRSNGHSSITVQESGLCVMVDQPYIGASPDGFVSCGDCEDSEGLLEIKRPFKYRDFSPKHAATHKDFCCVPNMNGQLTLKVVRLRDLDTEGNLH